MSVEQGKPGNLVADTGYFSESNVNACGEQKITPLISVKREEHHPEPMARFTEPPPLKEDATENERRTSFVGTSYAECILWALHWHGQYSGDALDLIQLPQSSKSSIMTTEWYTMLEFEPPMVGCVISSRNYTFDLLTASRECVINIPTIDLAEKVVGVGNSSGREVDKFKVFGLTELAAECYANLECKVVDDTMVEKYNLFVLEVCQAWTDPTRRDPRTLHHRGSGAFMVAGKTIQLASNMK